MILQEEFRKNGYTDILKGDVASEYGINLEDIFDLDEKPEELLGIFISEQKDDLFFLLDGDSMEINSLCDGWDNRIRVFAIINKKASVIQKLRYNIVQLIVYSGDTPDKNREGNLSISRKIIIKGDMTDRNQIIIGDDEVIELPFHMISSASFAPDEKKMERLEQLLPENEKLLTLMKRKNIKVQKKEREEQLLGECKEQEIKEGYQQILTVLGYKFENETVQQTYEKVKNIIKKSYVVSSFSYDIFVSKLNAIDSILANKTLSDLRKKIEENAEKNKILDTEIEELQELKDIASQRAKDIRDAVEKLSQDEYKRVGPALGKFYNKLARFNSNEGINIIPEKEGISLVDNNGKNIVNILSNGQISVFMLAHFFASINVRNDREKMKIYFIDDLTACMDDVNMLAFMDLLKYQMSSKATMEQLFFATCDNRISNLLKYKLDGRGIEFCELLESDFE